MVSDLKDHQARPSYKTWLKKAPVVLKWSAQTLSSFFWCERIFGAMYSLSTDDGLLKL
jgi:hypothetical protein